MDTERAKKAVDKERARKAVDKERARSVGRSPIRGGGVGGERRAVAWVEAVCHENGVNAFDYLCAVQRHVARVRQEPERWMPWNYPTTEPGEA